MTGRGSRTWVDGDLVAADQARVSVHDRGFRCGEGVFETLRVYSGHVFRMGAHLQRALNGAGRLGITVPGAGQPADRLVAALETTVAANREVLGDDVVLRLILTPGAIDPDSPFPGTPRGRATVVVTCHPLPDLDGHRRGGLRVVTVPWARPLPGVKSLSCLPSLQARRRARAEGAAEALLTSGEGEVLEGAGSNVFAVRQGVLVTPPPEAGILPGVTREVVLSLAAGVGLEAVERRLTIEEILAAEEVMVTASVREVVPVVSVDGHRIGEGTPGPWADRLWTGYREEVERERRLTASPRSEHH